MMLQHGGIDTYVLKTKPELLGHEGMRIRIMVREKQAEKAANGEVSPVKSSPPTPVPPPAPEVSSAEVSASLS